MGKIHRKKKVGILSLFYHNWNFGGMLQAYARRESVQKLGYEAEHVCYSRIPSANKKSGTQEKIRAFLAKRKQTNEILHCYYYFINRDKRNLKKFRSFEKEIPHGQYLGNMSAMTANAQKYDCLIAGSDQIWNPIYLREEAIRAHGLTFVEGKTKKFLTPPVSVRRRLLKVGKSCFRRF
ncbi:MAG: hypothetical protein Q4C72_03205 [Eubacteriales bacterium]|nr:hypothetical protein [Eubacteriales bacterium]